jgi:threonine aldolase
MEWIDFRSDTVSHPTPAMRHAMAEAAVGDDVYGDDPTVNELQALAAKMLGKEAALFVTSGTMGNITAMFAHCGRGERAIMGDKAHTNKYEAGNPAVLGGIQPYCVPVQPDGRLLLDDIEAAISPTDDPHFPITRLVSLENTQGTVGGQPLPLSYIQQVADLCQRYDLHLHIDGARIFNAAVALQTPIHQLVAPADSVTFCLSKGLCAPVGSVLVGSQEFINRALRVRKLLGGAMRQAGILAAAGIVALNEMVTRLAEDHANARHLADGLARIPGVVVEPERVKTNMVFFDLAPDAKLDAKSLAQQLKQANILINPMGPYKMRAVTHYWIKPNHVDLFIQQTRRYLS